MKKKDGNLAAVILAWVNYNLIFHETETDFSMNSKQYGNSYLRGRWLIGIVLFSICALWMQNKQTKTI